MRLNLVCRVRVASLDIPLRRHDEHTNKSLVNAWRLKANSHIPCRSPAATLPFSDSAERRQVAHMPSLDGRC
jgi:hypothetical protein